jgi:hypothetical protein
MGLTYLELIAEEIRMEVPGSVLPDENTKLLFRIYAVLLLAKGRSVEASDVHNAWVAWMCSVDPAHEALRPFEQLSYEVARMDDSYVSAIRAVAIRRMESGA